MAKATAHYRRRAEGPINVLVMLFLALVVFRGRQVAGVKIAADRIWGPVTKVVTPHKLILFVVFQASTTAGTPGQGQFGTVASAVMSL